MNRAVELGVDWMDEVQELSRSVFVCSGKQLCESGVNVAQVWLQERSLGYTCKKFIHDFAFHGKSPF